APRSGAAALAQLRTVLRADWRGWRGWAFEDLVFLFLLTALVLQLLLVFDPRYRDFPLATFAVPLVAVLAQALLADWPGPRSGGWAAGALVAAALVGAVQEGPANLEALAWVGCALLLAAPALGRRRTRPVGP
ncbi:MAG: hypothetical protein JWP04_4113, partial [Belnapia sp.]|nr:hypothetical protein [Belnapia sp.]